MKNTKTKDDNKNKRTVKGLLQVRRNFQITIPQDLRKELQLTEGDYLETDVRNGSIVIKPFVLAKDKGIEQKIKRARKGADLALDQLWAGLKKEDSEKIEQLIDEAVKEARRSKNKSRK